MKLRSYRWTWISREIAPGTLHTRVTKRMKQFNVQVVAQIFAQLFVVCVLSACAVSAGKDPMKSLSNPESLPVVQVAAMEKLDETPTPEYISALKRMMWQPGFAESTRLAAFERLVKLDEPGLKEILRLQLPKLMALAWRQTLCELIVTHQWVDMTPTLVRAWSVPMAS